MANEVRDIHKRVFGCSICRRSAHGCGNSAAPINDGYCCNSCNENVVIPARFERMYAAIHAQRAAEDN